MIKKGEAILLNSGFPGREHGIISYPKPEHGIISYLKPKNEDHPRWQAKYNNGHPFIQRSGEHLFVQLYNWAVCRDPSTKLGMTWEQPLPVESNGVNRPTCRELFYSGVYFWDSVH